MPFELSLEPISSDCGYKVILEARFDITLVVLDFWILISSLLKPLYYLLSVCNCICLVLSKVGRRIKVSIP